MSAETTGVGERQEPAVSVPPSATLTNANSDPPPVQRRPGFRVQCIGGVSEVGASCLVVEAAGKRILVDAGIRPGRSGGDMLPDLARLQSDGGIDAVIITHAHADHIGTLPLAVGAFPHAPVLTTAATADLMRVMLADSVRIAEGRWRDSGELPPYAANAVEALLARVHPLAFHDPYPLFRDDPSASRASDASGDWQVTLFPAGHVLGAAMVLLDTPDGTLLVSGDVSLAPQRTVAPAAPSRRRVDALILESTYGNRLHSVRAAEEARLVDQVTAVLARGGHCLIPTFALGRAQEVLLILAEARRDGRLAAPVWVDGLVRTVCGVYGANPTAVTPSLRRLIERQGNPFIAPARGVYAVEFPAQREEILAGEPAVIVASSGMLTDGPSVYYARHLAEDARHAILITGYQDEESAGPSTPKRLTLEGQEVEARFAFPRVAERIYGPALAYLGRETGWRIEARPTPDQELLREAAISCLPHGLASHGTVSFHLDRGEIVVTATGDASPDDIAVARARFTERTGYTLTIELPRAVIKASRAAAEPVQTTTVEPVHTTGAANGVSNAKSALSDLAQALRWPPPRYETAPYGEPHRPVFEAVATVVADGTPLASSPAIGPTKKDAEQAAARELLALLTDKGVITSRP